MLLQARTGDPDGRGEGDHRAEPTADGGPPTKQCPTGGGLTRSAPGTIGRRERRVLSRVRGGRRRAVPVVSPLLFRRLAIASLVAVCLIVLTGAAVRLTGSGLGCPDWPSCYQRRVTPQLSFHPLVEFSNRLVTVVLMVLIALTFLAAIRRRPFRRDLTWLSVGLLAGVVAQAVIGAIAVYTKLNPYVVVLHFLASMALVGLWRACSSTVPTATTRPARRPPRAPGHRCSAGGRSSDCSPSCSSPGPSPPAPGRTPGTRSGQLVARRIPVALRDMAELHSSLALLLVGVVVGLSVALHAMAVPERVRRAARMLCGVLVLQAAVGYTQYFTHLPAALVEVHVLGATALVLGAVRFHLALTDHAAEPSGPGSADDVGPVRAPTESLQVGG